MELADKALPFVSITLAGKTYALVCNFMVLVRFQEETGKNPFAPEFLNSLSPRDMVVLLWAAIKEHEPSFTVEDVAKLMHGTHLSVVGELISKLFNRAQPPADSDTALEEKKI